MSTFQSIGTAEFDSGSDNNVVVTKPTGVAVGDFLLTCIYGMTSNLTNITPPAGWTTLVEQQSSSGSTATQAQRLEVYHRTATSDDVSASTYTFTTTDGSTGDNNGGLMLRISNFGAVNVTQQTGGTGIVSSFTATTITPTLANCLFVAFVSQGLRGTDSPYSPGEPSFATDNPTWTSRGSVVRDVTNNTHTLTCYTASRSQTTATGTITFPTTNTGTSNTYTGIVVALAPRVDGSLSAPEVRSIGYTFTPIQSVVVEASVTSPTTNTVTPTTWTPVTKS